MSFAMEYFNRRDQAQKHADLQHMAYSHAVEGAHWDRAHRASAVDHEVRMAPLHRQSQAINNSHDYHIGLQTARLDANEDAHQREMSVRRFSSAAPLYRESSFRPTYGGLDHHDYSVQSHADRLHERELAHQHEMSVRRSGLGFGASVPRVSAFRSSFSSFASPAYQPQPAVCPVESFNNKMSIRNSGNHALAGVHVANTRLSGFGF